MRPLWVVLKLRAGSSEYLRLRLKEGEGFPLLMDLLDKPS